MQNLTPTPSPGEGATIPCRVLWCDSSTHPADAVLHHVGTVATFAAGTVTVRLAWAERADGRLAVGPHLQVSRTDPYDPVDPTADEARIWADCIDALAPGEVTAFTRALVDGSAAIEATEDSRIVSARGALAMASQAVASGNLGYDAESVVETLRDVIEDLLELIAVREERDAALAAAARKPFDDLAATVAEVQAEHDGEEGDR
jgi:hypothetical protein